MNQVYPGLLRLVQESVERGSEPQDGINWNREAWSRHFPNSHPVAAHLSALDDGEPLDRERLLGLSADVHAASGADRLNRLERLFVWSQVWGHGKVGYGAYRVHSIMSGDQFSGRLGRVYEALLREGSLAAHDCLRRGGPENIRGFGQAFATKFLHFAGNHVVPPGSPQPLILDRLVGLALHKGEPTVFGKRTGEDWNRSDFANYLDAAEWLCSQPELSDCEPATIEFHLFKTGDSLNGSRGPNVNQS